MNDAEPVDLAEARIQVKLKRADQWHALGVPYGAADKLVRAGIYTRTDLACASDETLNRLGIRPKRIMARILALLET